MKIDSKVANYEVTKNLPNATAGAAAGRPHAKEVTADQNDGSQDTIVRLSPASKEVQLAEKIISETPDVRKDRVSEIRDRIDSGTYEIDHEEVAAKLLDSSLDELF